MARDRDGSLWGEFVGKVDAGAGRNVNRRPETAWLLGEGRQRNARIVQLLHGFNPTTTIGGSPAGQRRIARRLRRQSPAATLGKVSSPAIDPTTLRELLAAGHESDTVDFKRSLDLGDTRAVVELAADVAAFQFDGGYLVIGVDNFGSPTGELTPAQLRLLDEATLRPKLERYLPGPIDLRVVQQQIDGNTVVLIRVGRHPDGFVIMKADGQTSEALVFRKGDVYMRHGTSSERWNQSDIPRIRQRLHGRPELVPAVPSLHRLGETIKAEGSPYTMWVLRAFIELENVGDEVARIISATASGVSTGIPMTLAPSAIAPRSRQPLELQIHMPRGNDWPVSATFKIDVEYEGGGTRRRLTAQLQFYKVKGWENMVVETTDL